MVSFCGKTRFVQDVEEEFSWLTMANGGLVVNVA